MSIKLKQVKREKNSTFYNMIALPTLLLGNKTFDKHIYTNEIQTEDTKFLESVGELSVR